MLCHARNTILSLLCLAEMAAFANSGGSSSKKSNVVSTSQRSSKEFKVGKGRLLYFMRIMLSGILKMNYFLLIKFVLCLVI